MALACRAALGLARDDVVFAVVMSATRFIINLDACDVHVANISAHTKLADDHRTDESTDASRAIDERGRYGIAL